MSQTLDADLEAILGGIEEPPKKEAAAPPPALPSEEETGATAATGGAPSAAPAPPPPEAAAAAAPAAPPPAVAEAPEVVPQPPAVASEVVEAAAVAGAPAEKAAEETTAAASAEKAAEKAIVAPVATSVTVPPKPRAALGARRLGLSKRKVTVAAPAAATNKGPAAAATTVAAAKTTTAAKMAVVAPSKAPAVAAAAAPAEPAVSVLKAKNAYMLFSLAKQAEVRGANPTLSICEVSKLLGAQWREASEETKAHFTELAAASKAAAEAFAAENPETVAAFQLAASQKRALKKNGGGGGGAGASSSSSNGRRPSTALELFSADVAETVSAAAGGARGAELRKLVLEAWEGASAGSRAPYLSRATAEAAAFASSAVASSAAAGGGASKKRGRTKKRDADELEETEAYLADAARLKAMLTSSTTAAAAADSDDEDEEEREEGTDWGLAPPLAVLGLSPRRTHFLVARAGAPLFAYGLVSASLAARARAGDPQAMAECPLPPAMLDEFEESETAFARDLAARADGTGGYDLSEIAEALCFAGGGSFPSSSSRSEGAPIAATAAPPLDSFAFLGAMRHARAGLLGKPAPAEKGSSSKRLNRDVMVQVPALALSRLVRRIQVAAAAEAKMDAAALAEAGRRAAAAATAATAASEEKEKESGAAAATAAAEAATGTEKDGDAAAAAAVPAPDAEKAAVAEK